MRIAPLATNEPPRNAAPRGPSPAQNLRVLHQKTGAPQPSVQNSKTLPAFRFLLSALALLAALLASTAPAAVIISEIMFNAQGSDRDSTGPNYTFNREWVELFNTGAGPVDIGGWQFGDAQDGDWASPFPLGVTLGPGQAIVVTGDATTFNDNWGSNINLVPVTAFPNLANTIGGGEAAAIRNAQGVIQDQVRFQDAGWPVIRDLGGRDGTSIFLKPGGLSSAGNDVPANWQISSQGVYGARYVAGGGEGENHGSPGVVHTQQQAPFVPSPDAVWSMVIMPDTQNYNKDSVDYPILTQLTNWIKDNRDAYNIQVVLQEGDIVNQNSQVTPTSGDQTANQQWANARAAFSVLDGHVPYILSVGNHDLGTTSAQNRETQINTYFQASQNSLVDPAQGGILKGYQEPGRLENAYFEVNAPDGRDMLIFSLEFWPTQATVTWANQIASLPQYENHTAVVLTHSYLNPNNTRSDGVPDAYPGVGDDANDGEQLWQELVKFHGNFELTFNGHVGGDQVGYLGSIGVEGNPVHQMVFNSQFEINGGNVWIRIVEFLQDGTTARIRTYSPFLDAYRTDAANQFEIELSQLADLIADFDGDRDVDGDDLADWMAGYGPTATEAQGDADGDGDADGADFLTWQRNVTSYASASAATAAVPEPATLLLAAILAACGLANRACQSGKRRAESGVRHSIARPSAFRFTLSAFLLLASTASAQHIIAHRGASYDAPENTLAAFNLAWQQGADGIEGDFYLSSDGKIICCHDKDTKRTAGVLHVIKETPLDELRKLEVGAWKNEKYRGERMPTFEEVVATVPDGKLFFIELKTGPEIVTPLKKLIDAAPLEREQMVIICFNADTVAECERQMPDLKSYWLVRYEQKNGQWTPTRDEVAAEFKRSRADGVGTEAQTAVVDREFLDGLSNGAPVDFGVWTVDKPRVARFYKKLGAWSITTNRPGFIREQLAAKPKAAAAAN